MTSYRARRVQDEARPDDGFRVLADRLWPRGVSKERAALDLWAKDATPSNELRKWFHTADDDVADEFRNRYLAELDDSGAARALARQLEGHKVATLLTAVKDPEHCHLQVLIEALTEAG
ncbi:DUF488 family protein [Mariniluteicoccus endophyticus]